LKTLSLLKDGIFPFYVHADFGLIKDEKFKLQLLKLSNGYLRFDKQVHQAKTSSSYLKCYVSVVKSGERFVDEVALVQWDQAHS
jgi:hypothetical protein